MGHRQTLSIKFRTTAFYGNNNSNGNLRKIKSPTMQITALNNILDSIDAFVEKYPVVQQYATKMEQATGVRSGYLIFGLVLAPLSIFFMPILLNAFTIGYPLLMSVKAIERGKADRTRWLMYWLLFHLISLVEPLFSWALSHFTGFALLKFAYLLWCMAPMERNGCYLSYRFLQPVVLKHIGIADGYLADVTGRVENVIQENKDKLKDVAINAAVNQVQEDLQKRSQKWGV